MSESQTFEGVSQAVLDQHRQIHFYFDQIQLTLEGLGGDSTDVEPMRRLAAQLEGLRERICEHQLAEERGGLYQALRDALPECRAEIRRLREQHARMIEVLEMARIHAQCGEPAEAEALREDLLGFFDEFRRHERDEEALIQRAIRCGGESED